MGLFDKAKDAISDRQDDIKNQASQHSDQVEQGIDKAGNTVDDKTGGKFLRSDRQGPGRPQRQAWRPLSRPQHNAVCPRDPLRMGAEVLQHEGWCSIERHPSSIFLTVRKMPYL